MLHEILYFVNYILIGKKKTLMAWRSSYFVVFASDLAKI